MLSFRANEVLGVAMVLALMVAGCKVPTREQLACQDAGEKRVEDACAVAISDVASMDACLMAFGEGYELRVCLPETGLGCEELVMFGTDVDCLEVVVACCPMDP